MLFPSYGPRIYKSMPLQRLAVTPTHTHTNANSLAADNSDTRTWQSTKQAQCEPVLTSSWSRARYSQESDHASQLLGVGTQSPTWTLKLVFSETWPGNLHPGKFQVLITAGCWCAKVLVRWTTIPHLLRLELTTLVVLPTQPQCHTHTHTHTHTA